MKLNNFFLQAIIGGFILGLANPVLAMHSDQRWVERTRMIFNHISPPEENKPTIQQENEHALKQLEEKQQIKFRQNKRAAYFFLANSVLGASLSSKIHWMRYCTALLIFAGIRRLLDKTFPAEILYPDRLVLLKTCITQKAFIKDFSSLKAGKFAGLFAALSIFHWVPEERASRKAFLGSLLGTATFSAIATAKIFAKFEEIAQKKGSMGMLLEQLKNK